MLAVKPVSCVSSGTFLSFSEKQKNVSTVKIHLKHGAWLTISTPWHVVIWYYCCYSYWRLEEGKRVDPTQPMKSSRTIGKGRERGRSAAQVQCHLQRGLEMERQCVSRQVGAAQRLGGRETSIGTEKHWKFSFKWDCKFLPQSGQRIKWVSFYACEPLTMGAIPIFALSHWP